MSEDALDDRARHFEFEHSYAELLTPRRPARGDTEPVKAAEVYVPLTAVPMHGGGPAFPADQVIGPQRRSVLRGVAGSGKTALIRKWVEERARELVLVAGEGLVPFPFTVDSLRRGHSTGDAEGLLRGLDAPLPQDMPPGWVERVLATGRGLLLVDEFDEASPYDQQVTVSWLYEILSIYPDTACLVAKRGRDVDTALEALGFQDFDLHPMDLSDVRRFVAQWHDEALPSRNMRATVWSNDSFLRDVETYPVLRELVANPLICSYLCTTYYERGLHPPLNRAELSRAILTLFLNRPPAVPFDAPDEPPLSEAQQVMVLQRIAAFLQRNGLQEASLAQAHQQMAVALAHAFPSLPEADAGEVLGRLVRQSGVLASREAQHVAFTHRTLQEFLAAKDLLESDSIGELLRHVHEDQWADVFLHSVGYARPNERTGLVEAVLRRGEAEPDLRWRLWPLAVEAAGEVPELDHHVHEQIEARIAELVPPRRVGDALALARAGAHIIPLLPDPEQLDPGDPSTELLLLTVDTIGGPAAEAYRSQVPAPAPPPPDPAYDTAPPRSRPRSLSPLVVETWNHDTVDRAPAVRSVELVGNEGRVTHRAPTDSGHRLVYRGDVEDFSALRRAPLLHTLVIEDNPSLTHLDDLTGLPRLRTLVISRCPGLLDLSALASTGVMFLELSPTPEDRVLVGLTSASRLRALYLPVEAVRFDSARLGRQLTGVAVLPGLRIDA
ncbi:NACHT domain-containing protein [Streptomyces sp. NPDC056361]|uniref:NACHT domain-containing protein n=1 Tax=Streptomyces sp. NPDC056361 TaxID=3345795 RepID=UPI0035E1D446